MFQCDLRLQILKGRCITNYSRHNQMKNPFTCLRSTHEQKYGTGLTNHVFASVVQLVRTDFKPLNEAHNVNYTTY